MKGSISLPLMSAITVGVIAVSAATNIVTGIFTVKDDVGKDITSLRVETTVNTTNITAINGRLDRIETKIDRVLEKGGISTKI